MKPLKIITGKISEAMKVVLYGTEGIGKTTLAAQFPEPLFIDTEGSTKFIDISRTERPTSWAMLLDQVSCVWEDPSLCRTLVIDTADWAEQLCAADICAQKKISSIEEIGYGKGYIYLAEEFGRLLNTLSEITERGSNVVLTAHAKMRKFEQPDELGAYDRWELKLQKTVASLVKEWADLLLFANYKTFSVAVDKDGKKHKAQGGKRVMYTTHHPCWDAKNRLGLPDELPMDYAPLAPYFGNPPIPDKPSDNPSGPSPSTAPEPPALEPSPAEQEPAVYVPEVLKPLLESAGVTEAEVREVIAQRQGSFPLGTPWKAMERVGFVEGWVLPFWEKIVQMIKENPDRLPF